MCCVSTCNASATASLPNCLRLFLGASISSKPRPRYSSSTITCCKLCSQPLASKPPIRPKRSSGGGRSRTSYEFSTCIIYGSQRFQLLLAKSSRTALDSAMDSTAAQKIEACAVINIQSTWPSIAAPSTFGSMVVREDLLSGIGDHFISAESFLDGAHASHQPDFNPRLNQLKDFQVRVSTGR